MTRSSYLTAAKNREKTARQFTDRLLRLTLLLIYILLPEGWADPGGTAIPGQPVGKSKQAPASSPGVKNRPDGGRIRY